jgi:DNA-directed RNA polymerase specialized sigma24 family protein
MREWEEVRWRLGVTEATRLLPAAAPPSRVVVLAVRRAQAGDRGAFAFLRARFADDVCLYATSLLGSAVEGEDVTDRTFAAIAAIIDQYDEREGSLLAWMLGVARDIALEHKSARSAVVAATLRELGVARFPGASDVTASWALGNRETAC